MSPEGLCAFRAAVTARLDAMGRRWRTAYESQAFTTQRIPVGAGLAVAATLPSLIGPDLEILDPDTAGLPELPTMDIRLYRSPGRASEAVACLAELIIERVRDSRPMACIESYTVDRHRTLPARTTRAIHYPGAPACEDYLRLRK